MIKFGTSGFRAIIAEDFNKENVQKAINVFKRMTYCTFDLNAFEARAQELESAKPGKGYKLAYKEILKNLCEQLVQQSKDGKNPVGVRSVHKYFEDVMQVYQKECKKENFNINVEKSFKEDVFGNDLNYFQNMKENVNAFSSPMGIVYDQFKNGKLTGAEMIEFTRSKTQDYLDIKDAETIATYARVMETVNSNRSFMWKVTHLFTHIKEKLQIREMRNTLKENCEISIENLERAALKEGSYTKEQREAINEEIREVTNTSIKPLEIEEEKVDLEKTNTRIQLNIELEQEAIDEKSPRVDENHQVSKNRVME